MRFPERKNFENRLRFDKITESLMVGTFLRHSVVYRHIRKEPHSPLAQVVKSLAPIIGIWELPTH